MKALPSRERVAQLLGYDPQTGRFWWHSRSGRPGHNHIKGYRQIRIDDVLCMEHWLAWLLVHGYWPERLDHINLDRADNRIANLRVATNGQNRANSKVNANSVSGIKGVRKVRRWWRARIRAQGRLVDLGKFDTAQKAAEAYASAARLAFGEFARPGKSMVLGKSASNRVAPRPVRRFFYAKTPGRAGGLEPGV